MATKATSRCQWVSLETLSCDEDENLGSSRGGIIHPYIEEDLKDSRKVEIYRWVEAVFGVSRTRIDEWTSQIGTQRWFFDPEIQDSLKKYCEAIEELDRYGPFCGLANRILHLARGNLSGVTEDDPYPIDTTQFVKTSGCMVSEVQEQTQLYAAEYLNVSLIHSAAISRFKALRKLDWTDILHFVELKLVEDLTDVLAEEIKDRETALTRPAVTPSARAGRRRPGQKTRSKKRPKVDKIQEDFHVGTKRPREVVDPVEALKVDSSCGRRSSPKYGIYQGKMGILASGSHALELLSSTYGTRAYCHSTVLQDDKLCLWYYDACGIIHTDQYLSLISDFEKTAAILVALASCTPERSGTLPASVIKPPTPCSKTLLPCTLAGSVLQVRPVGSDERYKITLKDSLYTQRILAGRRTFAYSIADSSPRLSNQNLIAKFSYQLKSRRPEHEFIDIARKAGVDHIPEYHLWADLWKMSDGARRVFFADNEGDTTYEDRTLRMIVYTEYRSIKTLFKERLDLMPTMVEQLVNCLHDLHYKANILHRDVSVNNIMFEKRGKEYIFILNDFDMATVLATDDGSPYTPSARHRTGTLPFMACALLHDAVLKNKKSGWNSTRHLLWYDYESLFWVCLWCVLALFLDCLPEPERKANLKILRSWEDPNLYTACSMKLLICTDLLQNSSVVLPHASLPLLNWFNGWTLLLDDAYGTTKKQSRKQQHGVASKIGFDRDTVGGVMSKDNILKVLTPLASPSQAGPPQISETPTPPKRRSCRKEISAEAQAVKAVIMSRLRPRKTA